MPPDLSRFIATCAQAGILIDTNLLLLLAIGNENKANIKSDTRTSAYSEIDYNLLIKIIKISKYNLMITPYMVSEISNHLVDSKGKISQYYDVSKKIVGEASESHYHKDVILSTAELSFLGFTDVSILRIAEKKGCAVITADLNLYSKLLEKGRDAAHLPTLVAFGSHLF